ncbi:MAG: ABC transporter permease [Acidobacteriia bacterium]|nr:ABC transporter permease [Terriglobia bacterium]
MGALLQDLRFGLRVLGKRPGIALVAVLSLALGIGANSAVFSIIDGFYLRPLPVKDPGELVTISSRDAQGEEHLCSYPNFLDLRNQNTVFTDILAYGDRGAFIKTDVADGLVSVSVVSENYFSVLGVKPALGRTFSTDLKSSQEGEPGVVISQAAWQKYFNGSPTAIGQSISVDGKSLPLLGVAPRGFRGLDRTGTTALWITPRTWSVMLSGAHQEFESRSSRWFSLSARTKPGVARTEISAQLKVLSQGLDSAYPEANKGREFTSQTEEERFWKVMPFSLFILAMVGLVLLIACANVANLLLAQQEGRHREIAVRLAVGASRGRLLRQWLTEGVLLAILGGGVGLLLLQWFMEVAPAVLPPSYLASGPDIRIDARVVLFTTFASLFSILLSGLIPGWQATRCEVAPVLKGDTLPSTGRSRFFSLKNGLTIAEIALSVVLLIGAGLLVKSLLLTLQIKPGFDPNKNVLIVDVGLAEFFGYSSAQSAALRERILERVRAVPGVRQASIARRSLLNPSEAGEMERVEIPGYVSPDPEKGVRVRYNIVGLNFFSTLGTRVLHGRDFGPQDSPTNTRSLVVNEAMARRFWPNSEALGQWLRIQGKEHQIVGIVEDGRYLMIHEATQPYLFFPLAQRYSEEASLFIEMSGDPRSISKSVLREARNAAGKVPIVEARTLHDHMRLALFDDWSSTMLLAGLGVLGLFLAATGLFSVVSFLVSRRMREMGIRVALGARPREIQSLVLGDSLRMSLIGVAIGLGVALGVMRLMSSWLFGVKAHDLSVYLASSVVAIAITLAASWYPAQKASRVDPMQVLRHQ